MALVEGRALTSSDPCVSIVHGLLRHRKGDENDPFPKKAIESLVRKLKEKRDELDSLIQAVTSNGEIPSKCVTIPRTLDGRLQVATRKGFPHVVYARIWRWPDVHKNEMKHVRFCQFAFDLKRDGICINPYHYERIVPTGIDLAGLSIQQMAGAEGYGMMDDSFSPYQRRSSAGDVLSSGADSNDVQDSYSDPYTPQQPDSRLAMTSHSQHIQLVKQHSHPESTAALSGWVNQVNQCSPTTSWVEPPEMPSLVRQSPIKLEPVAGHSGNFGDVPVTHDTFHSQPPTVYVPQAAPVVPESVAYLAGRVAGTVAATDFWRNVVSSSDSVVTSPLSARPLPDIWCSITYFELDDRVGEIFKVPLTCPVVTVDGYTNPSSPDRFCLGKLTNVQRTETTEKARLHIGKGVQLVLEGEGDVWVKCLSDHSIFVQSYYLDRESGRQPGDAVHKIYPAAFIKVFDLNQCYTQMRQWAAVSQPTNSNLPFAASVAAGGLGTMGIGADDLRSLCVLRLSFVKGWGPDYPRPTIKDTPCWIEIQLHRPLQLLDEVLQMLASKESTANAQFGPL